MPADGAKSIATLRGDWPDTLRPDPALDVADAVIDEWKTFSTRTFIDEIDGFPAMAVGSPPRAAESSVTPLLSLHPDRGGDIGMKPFYQVLRAKNGVSVSGPPATSQLGNVWAEQRDAFRFDNRSLVAVIAGIQAGRAQRISAEPAHIAISIAGGNYPMPVTPAAGGRRAVEFNFFDAMPDTVDSLIWRTIAHELGHSFGLGDEYVDLPGNYTAPEMSTDTWGNLTTLAGISTGGAISAPLIKWTWHRARKAAVLSGGLTPSGSNFKYRCSTPAASSSPSAIRCSCASANGSRSSAARRSPADRCRSPPRSMRRETRCS